MTETRRVLIIAQDPLARAGLSAMLSTGERWHIVGQLPPDTPNIDTFAADALLFDVGWDWDSETAPLDDSPVFAHPAPPVVLVPDEEAAPALIHALDEAQRDGYGVLLRNAPQPQIEAALVAAIDGLAAVQPALVAALIGNPTPPPDIAPLDTPLTAREQEVLDLLAQGLANKTIARQLHISEYTVKYHVNAILSKFNAASRTEAVVYAVRLGLVTL